MSISLDLDQCASEQGFDTFSFYKVLINAISRSRSSFSKMLMMELDFRIYIIIDLDQYLEGRALNLVGYCRKLGDPSLDTGCYLLQLGRYQYQVLLVKVLF